MATCYYPNGDPTKENDIPCGSGNGVACCPSGWQCQDNGLCYLQNMNYYGRYTCTDKTWKSSGCPNICTHGLSAPGNEAILQCSSGSFCCDANRPELSGGQACCQSSTDRFTIQNRAMVNGTSNGSGAGSSSGGSSSAGAASSQQVASSSSPSQSAAAASSGNIATSVSTRQPSVVVVTSTVSDGANVGVTTATQAVVVEPNGVTSVVTEHVTATGSASDSSPSGSSHARTSAIVGGVVGGLAGLAIIAFLLFIFFRRRRTQNRYPNSPPTSQTIAPMYPDMMKTPVSPYAGAEKSELEGSTPDLTAGTSPGGSTGGGTSAAAGAGAAAAVPLSSTSSSEKRWSPFGDRSLIPGSKRSARSNRWETPSEVGYSPSTRTTPSTPSSARPSSPGGTNHLGIFSNTNANPNTHTRAVSGMSAISNITEEQGTPPRLSIPPNVSEEGYNAGQGPHELAADDEAARKAARRLTELPARSRSGRDLGQ